jgi:ribonuclease R
MQKKPPRGAGQDWREHDPDRANEAERYEHPIPSRKLIQQALEQAGEPLTLEALVVKLGLTPQDSLEAIDKRLAAMVRDGQVARNRVGAYGLVKEMNLVAGQVQAHRDGFGFLIPDEGGPDIFLPPRQMRELMNGDRALVRITGTDDRGRREGALADVLERGSRLIVGRLHADQGVTYVIPDNPRVQQDLLIPPESRLHARHGQMVVAEIITPPGKRTLPVGKVTEILGEHLAPGMEIEASIRTHSLPNVWPEDVVREAAAIPDTVQESQTQGRMDFRGIALVTIDGSDARDFDDAVYAEPAKTGWKLWVAIADVAAYVTPGSPLDREALVRGTSVYFPERVIPMLPEKLSNGLCSLNPDVDRLCMVCEMRVMPDGEIASSQFFEGVMRSRARLVYEDVARMLDHPDVAKASSRHGALVPHLQTLNEVFKALFAARERRGAIDFDSTETKVVFDADRKIEKIVPVQRNRAHRLIEECMIAANVEAARFVSKRKQPAPYRIHEDPDGIKVTALREFLAGRGLRLSGGDKPTAMDYAKTLERTKERPDASVIQTVMLRSMMQAKYSATNVGHFGLALTHYAHFTSPIRRYPDLLLHRAIKHLLRARGGDFEYSHEDMERHGAHCSMAERRADEATRDVMHWLKCEYMREHVGDEFDGIVSGVAPFGLFVDLQGLYVEGLVHVTSLANDYYTFDKPHHRLVGERSKRAFGLGDRLRVRVVRVNLDERKIDLEPVDGKTAAGGKAGGKATGGKQGSGKPAGDTRRQKQKGRR